MKKESLKNVKSLNFFDIKYENLNKKDNLKNKNCLNIICFSFILLLIILIILTCNSVKKNT